MGEQQASEKVEFDCRELNCTEKVIYSRQVVSGMAYDPAGGPKTAYLECPRGHVHPYQLRG
jgi:hypothetical protein